MFRSSIHVRSTRYVASSSYCLTSVSKFPTISAGENGLVLNIHPGSMHIHRFSIIPLPRITYTVATQVRTEKKRQDIPTGKSAIPEVNAHQQARIQKSESLTNIIKVRRRSLSQNRQPQLPSDVVEKDDLNATGLFPRDPFSLSMTHSLHKPIHNTHQRLLFNQRHKSHKHIIACWY